MIELLTITQNDLMCSYVEGEKGLARESRQEGSELRTMQIKLCNLHHETSDPFWQFRCRILLALGCISKCFSLNFGSYSDVQGKIIKYSTIKYEKL